MKLAGLNDWETIGGVSGGSIPTAFAAAGLEPAELMQLAVDIDFSSLVPRHATPLTTIIAFLLRDRFAYTRPRKGVLSSENLGRFMDERISKVLGADQPWPKNYWTMAVVARTQVLFTADGVYQYLRSGQRRLLSDKPAPLGLAIRASCAVPGIIDSVPYNGRHLFDGALSWDGDCPVGIPVRHFEASPDEVIGLDVGEEEHRFAGLARSFWSLLCGNHCIGPESPIHDVPEGVLMMEPHIYSVRSLQFTLTQEQKWQAVHAGFREAVIELSREGLLPAEKRKEALLICADINRLKAMGTQGK
jgi:predicted acylesterase/phospholipase RssA